MSKKKWILLILVVAFIGYLLISKIYPGVGMGIDSVVGPTVSGAIGGIAIAITSSPTWQAYDIYFAMAFGVIITSILWWQGHNTYNKIRSVATQSAAKEAGWQTTPPVQAPTPIPSTSKTEVAPVPAATVEPKKEAAA